MVTTNDESGRGRNEVSVEKAGGGVVGSRGL